MEKQKKPSEHKNDKKKKEKRHVNSYMKYSGMGIQMGGIIFIGAYAGQKLDAHYQTSKPYFTVALALFSTFAALYIVLKDLIKKQDDE